MGKRINPAEYIGKKFGKWTVVGEGRVDKKNHGRYVVCDCDCGKHGVEVWLYNLLNGKSKSCGCNWYGENRYELCEDHYKVYDQKGNMFVISPESLAKTKKYYWYLNQGYAVRTIGKKLQGLHRYLLDASDNEVVDHANGIPWDNRLENLRTCTQHENTYNRAMSKANTSGVTGVHWCNTRQMWVAQGLSANGNLYERFENKEDAIVARKEWEKNFGEFRRSN